MIKRKFGAGEGNRTPVISLEGFCSTIELHPLNQPLIKRPRKLKWWRGMDSNHRRRSSTDLQSVAFDRSATPPISIFRDRGFYHPFSYSLTRK